MNRDTIQVELGGQGSNLVIAFQNKNGILQPIQGLEEYLYGPHRDLRILCTLYGRQLFDILVDDHNLIQYSENKVILAELLRNDSNQTIMNVMGKVGELL